MFSNMPPSFVSSFLQFSITTWLLLQSLRYLHVHFSPSQVCCLSASILLMNIIVTNNSSPLISKLISILAFLFSIKDLEALHYCLGFQALHNSRVLFLSQHKYVSDLIHKFYLHTTKHVHTPLPSRTTLSHIGSNLQADPAGIGVWQGLYGT